MSPEHPQLASLLQDAAAKRGGQAPLADALDISEARLSGLINGRRFVTMKEALRIEAVLGVSARELLIEAATAKIDEQLALARGSAK